MTRHLAPHTDIIKSGVTPFERHILMWCIETYVPLRELRPEDALVVFYEDFCVDLAAQSARMFVHIGYTPPDELPARATRPSALSRKESAVVRGGDRLTEWRRNISDIEVDRGLEILAAFGLDAIYDAGPTPRQGGLQFFRSNSDMSQVEGDA